MNTETTVLTMGRLRHKEDERRPQGPKGGDFWESALPKISQLGAVLLDGPRLTGRSLIPVPSFNLMLFIGPYWSCSCCPAWVSVT